MEIITSAYKLIWKHVRTDQPEKKTSATLNFRNLQYKSNPPLCTESASAYVELK